jgi:RNA polymerase sigma-70 factor (ECF subfamily)
MRLVTRVSLLPGERMRGHLMPTEGELSGSEALATRIDTFHNDVWRLCARLVDEQSAADLTQETFIRALRALSTFRGEASERTWILSIARNTCMDEFRSRSRRRQREALLSLGQCDEPLAPDVAEEVVVRDLLGRIEPDRRAALVLTQLLRMTYDEAAVVCGCPTGTIRSRVARARDDLIALLPEFQPTEQEDPERDTRSPPGSDPAP